VGAAIAALAAGGFEQGGEGLLHIAHNLRVTMRTVYPGEELWHSWRVTGHASVRRAVVCCSLGEEGWVTW
jgi:hypothetical protein